MLDKFFLKYRLFFFVAIIFSVFSATTYLQAQEKQKPEPIAQKLSGIEARLVTLEENQLLILKNQETIIQEIQQLKIRVRRT